jgi:Uncharacterized protein conserved in bacteria
MRDLWIRVGSLQKQEGADPETMEFFTKARGGFIEEVGCFRIFYQENQMTGMAGVLTRLDIFSDYVELHRSGEVKQKTKFVPGKPENFEYTIPEGTILLGVKTQKIEILREEGQVRSVDLNYEIWQGEREKLGDYRLAISIQEAQEKDEK